jgi:hypothetical protein
MDTELRVKVEEILSAIKSKSFVGGYIAADEEAMGLLVSKFFEWDGGAILRTAQFALEDANFHGESAKVGEMISAVTSTN